MWTLERLKNEFSFRKPQLQFAFMIFFKKLFKQKFITRKKLFGTVRQTMNSAQDEKYVQNCLKINLDTDFTRVDKI